MPKLGPFIQIWSQMNIINQLSILRGNFLDAVQRFYVNFLKLFISFRFFSSQSDVSATIFQYDMKNLHFWLENRSESECLQPQTSMLIPRNHPQRSTPFVDIIDHTLHLIAKFNTRFLLQKKQQKCNQSANLFTFFCYLTLIMYLCQ